VAEGPLALASLRSGWHGEDFLLRMRTALGHAEISGAPWRGGAELAAGPTDGAGDMQQVYVTPAHQDQLAGADDAGQSCLLRGAGAHDVWL
jgi:hypothetical protein